jgi:hypothetical protein
MSSNRDDAPRLLREERFEFLHLTAQLRRLSKQLM